MLRNLNFIILSLLLVGTGCNEEEFLQERPLDFFTPASSFNTFGQFESGLYDLYARVREIHYGGEDESYAHHYGTDMMLDARLGNFRGRIGDYLSAINPTSPTVSFHWSSWYKVVSSTNLLLAQLETSELTDDERQLITAEARFFRAFAYRYLTYLFGDVPLYLDAVDSPRTNFTRVPQADIFAQMIEDLNYAADNLPGITEVDDGRLHSLVARQVLAETYISTGQYAEAVAAASLVIDDPATALMQERFGSQADLEPGDVYFDLFRRGNQNRSSGNTEALWVAQVETDVPGGLLLSTVRFDGNLFERFCVPAGFTLNDPNGERGMLSWVGDLNAGGRGVGFMQPTKYFQDALWESDFDNDMRNASHNYKRDILYNDPESEFFGKSAVEFPGTVIQSAEWRFYPWLTKVTTAFDHPAPLYVDPENYILNANAGSTFRDMYYMRLAETYLLRAEAHLRAGDQQAAADDINVVRNRVGATPVAPAEVTIDYILDERARELSLEEQRRITLHRVGRLVERVRAYNPHNADEIQDYHGLWPIPLGDIEANTNESLGQNPGYQ